MKKRIFSMVLALAMLMSMSTMAFAAEDWETEIDVLQVATVGGQNYASLEDAFEAQIATGADCVSLSNDLSVKELVVPGGAVLDLNGYTLSAGSVDAIAPGAKIIDSTGGNGALKVSGQCQLNENNDQLPIKDAETGDIRLFNVSVKAVAITGKNSAAPKYWFQVNFENFDAVYSLISAGAAVDIKVLVNVDGVDAEAVASAEFVAQWAEAYKNNSGVYITAQLLDAEGKTVVATPAVGGYGVNIKGATM